MDTLIKFELLWHDTDVFEVRVAAWNGKFAGTADTYVVIGGLAEAARTFEGFPRSASDEREYEFGSFGPEWAGGAAKLRLYCRNSAGHSVVEAWFESAHDATGNAETAHFCGPVEANAIDALVSELRRMEDEKSGIALLRFLPE